MFKHVFTVLFAAAATTAVAQTEAMPAPVYDPQGRLIPYDVRPEPPPEVVSPRASSKAGAKAGKKAAKKTGKKASKKKRNKKASKQKAGARKPKGARAGKRPTAKSR